MKCCLVPLTSWDICTGKIWSCYYQKFMSRCVYKKIHFLTFDLDVIGSVTQYPRHHGTYAQAKFEVATTKSLWGDAFTRKYIIWPLTLTLGSRSHETSPTTLYIMSSMHLQSLKLLDGRTHGRTDRRTTDRLWYEINIPYFSNEKAGMIM